MASKRAAAAISSAADGDDDKEGDDDKKASGFGQAAEKKPRTLLEAAKELKKATANMDAGTIKQMRAKEEEHRMLREANQVMGCLGSCRFDKMVVRGRDDGPCRDRAPLNKMRL